VHLSGVATRTEIHDMADQFRVTRQMAVALCDAVLCGDLPTADLETIGFALVASDTFCWDDNDDEPAETFWDWAAPEVNFALTLENVVSEPPQVQTLRRQLALGVALGESQGYNGCHAAF
jgi:hypothetical protein